MNDIAKPWHDEVIALRDELATVTKERDMAVAFAESHKRALTEARAEADKWFVAFTEQVNQFHAYAITQTMKPVNAMAERREFVECWQAAVEWSLTLQHELDKCLAHKNDGLLSDDYRGLR